MSRLHPTLEGALSRWIDSAQAYALCVGAGCGDERAAEIAADVHERFRQVEALRRLLSGKSASPEMAPAASKIRVVANTAATL